MAAEPDPGGLKEEAAQDAGDLQVRTVALMAAVAVIYLHFAPVLCNPRLVVEIVGIERPGTVASEAHLKEQRSGLRDSPQ